MQRTQVHSWLYVRNLPSKNWQQFLQHQKVLIYVTSDNCPVTLTVIRMSKQMFEVSPVSHLYSTLV